MTRNRWEIVSRIINGQSLNLTANEDMMISNLLLHMYLACRSPYDEGAEVGQSVDSHERNSGGIQRYLHAITHSAVAIGLAALPAWGLSGTINDATLGSVSCLNYTTGMAVPATVSGSKFECSTLPSTEGDQVGIVSMGTAGIGPVRPPNPPSGDCPQVTETEPNDQFSSSQDLGTIAVGQCVTVNGSITMGIGSDPNQVDPNADIDTYRLTVNGVTRLRLSLQGNGGYLIIVFDANRERLSLDCGANGCETAVTDGVFTVAILGEQLVPYTLEMSDASRVVNSAKTALTNSTGGTLYMEKPLPYILP